MAIDDGELPPVPDLQPLLRVERRAAADLAKVSSLQELAAWSQSYLDDDGILNEVVADYAKRLPAAELDSLYLARQRIAGGLSKRRDAVEIKLNELEPDEGEMLPVPDLQPLLLLDYRARHSLENCSSFEELTSWNNNYLGESGQLTAFFRRVGQVPKPERPMFGVAVNRVKTALIQAKEAKQEELKHAELERSLTQDTVDITLPGRPVSQGRLHIATRIMRQITAIFADLGFQVYRSREVEDDLTNFELLNMPPHHPARDMWDTFHTTTPGVILRTHTSPGQIHVMRELCPEPIRVILPGMCYRYEAITARSEIQFQQVEGLVVGQDITLADLKGTIVAFARRLFGQERQVRFRSSYFPFTEPSIEIDIDWPKEDPNADRLTKGTGWLEIMGAGMVHPTVLRNGGYDPAKYSGFAFGMGPQRITMLKYAIDDIRQFWGNDLRFLQQF